MKKIEKILCIIMSFLMTVLSLTACGKTETEKNEQKRIADDTSVMALNFTKPESYSTAEVFVSESADGVILEKDLSYTFENDSSLVFGYSPDVQLSEMLKIDTMDSREIDGIKVYTRESDGNYQAFIQKENDAYALQFEKPESEAAFEEVLNGISLSDATQTRNYDHDLYDVVYTIDETLPLFGTSVRITENADGEITKKSVNWNFGEDKDRFDFTLMIRVYKNSTIEAAINNAEKQTAEKEINGITYTYEVPSSTEDAPFSYYTQHGDDVYQIRNNGSSGGLFVTRSEESEAAFEAFLNGISFK